eukprot:10196318-Alexandrium_andersonii.AAC.1
MAFLPKGEEKDDRDQVVRDAHCTRPLAIADTAPKIVAKLFDWALAQAAGAVAQRSQHGFIRGRVLHDA